MAGMTGARFIAEMLYGYGVTHVFFVPAILKRTMAEMEARTNIARILTHSEKAAAYMADGYARATGRPGVCMAQLVGAANLAAGLRDPYLGCSPVIALTGGPTSSSRGRTAYQQIDDFSLFKPVTKFSAHVDSVERVPDLLRQAFRDATSGKPGPVHLEFEGRTGDVVDAAESDLELIVEERFSHVAPFRPTADVESVMNTALLLGHAERPIIIAGGGVRSSGARDELLELAEMLGIPIATSLNAKDTVPGDHPLSVGVVGLYSRACANRAVLEADLVFYVGSQTGGQVTLDWSIPRPGTSVIQLDIDPEELGRHYPNEVALLGDAKATLQQLVAAASQHGPRDDNSWLQRVQAMVAEWRSDAAGPAGSDDVPLRPERLCSELTDLLPDDAILVSDTGHSGIWSGCMIDLTKPGQSYIRAAGSLGWGFPAALGAKLALPQRPVIVFTGDGGFWYHLSELETAVRWGINAVVVVNNNRSLNQEIPTYAEAYGGRLHGRHGELWQFEDVDFARISTSIGANGIRVTNPGELRNALEQALASDGPTVVDAVTDLDVLAPLPFTGVDAVSA
jgi:acetolactate synthase-1/2/3 large subunit